MIKIFLIVFNLNKTIKYPLQKNYFTFFVLYMRLKIIANQFQQLSWNKKENNRIKTKRKKERKTRGGEKEREGGGEERIKEERNRKRKGKKERQK